MLSRRNQLARRAIVPSMQIEKTILDITMHIERFLHVYFRLQTVNSVDVVRTQLNLVRAF